MSLKFVCLALLFCLASTPATLAQDAKPETPESVRTANGEEIAKFARQRFGEIFGFVSDPIPLLINGRDFFELYCFSNNPRAFSLIKKGVDFVVKKYTPASRRRSGP